MFVQKLNNISDINMLSLLPPDVSRHVHLFLPALRTDLKVYLVVEVPLYGIVSMISKDFSF